MITKRVAYPSKATHSFLNQKRELLAELRKKMIKLGLDPNQYDVFTRPEYREKWLANQLDLKPGG